MPVRVVSAVEPLDELLAGPEPDYDADPQEFELPDATTANRMLGAVRKIDRDLEADLAVVRAEKDRLDRWAQARYAEAQERRSWLVAVLNRYHRAILATDGKRKTIGLPNGKLKMRGQQPSWTFDDELFQPWAQENLPGVMVTPPPLPAVASHVLAKAALTIRDDKGNAVKWGITTDGETPPGVTVNYPDDKFSLAFEDDEAPALEEA